MARPIIAVDIDEVLAQFIPCLATFHNSRYGGDMELSAESFVSYEFHNVWGGTIQEANEKMNAFFESLHFKEQIQPVPDAFRVLQQLKTDYELHIVTARQYKVEELTRAWVLHHYPDIFDEIHFGNHYSQEGKTRSKSEICKEIGAQLLIDDSIIYAAQCSRDGIPVILFGHYPWNKEFPTLSTNIQSTKTHNVREVAIIDYDQTIDIQACLAKATYEEHSPVVRVSTWESVQRVLQLLLPIHHPDYEEQENKISHQIMKKSIPCCCLSAYFCK